ncbi:ATP-binding protein [Thermococcus sp. ES12]|uniref:ATP-binding protein n=1 Tax=Thermococcus sp. ES12 TaxID=1638246 RepID=UPI00142F6E08|nr:AAA family ATPase [Thermococcus sp. ES12]NJE76010.1 ATP-binding protein [Thermococcus sp. ES12]
MDDRILTSLIATSRRVMAWARKFPRKRFLFDELRAIDEEYYVGIKGIRGVGKTVLLLQLANETESSVYFSADSTPIKPFSLYEVVKSLAEMGYRNIFIDEIHRKAGWAEDLKTLYDEHEVRVFFSGSSAIDLIHSGADLSRRVVLKELPPASFREWLNIRRNFNVPRYPLEEVLSRSFDLTNMYAELHPLWREYMREGGVLYPRSGFYDALDNSIRKVILEDLSALREVSVKYETDAFKLLYLVAKSAPFEANYSRIARALEVSKNMAIRLVGDLSKAGLLIVLHPCRGGRKEPKLYLTVPLREFFARKGFDTHRGALREEFFVNHLKNFGPCYLKGRRGEKTADFKVGEWVIEVGGESKGRYQRPDYIAVDGLITGKGRVPLFLFGLVY